MMLVRNSRVVVAALAGVIATLTAQSAYACYTNADCEGGQVCQDYVCKAAAPKPGGTTGGSSYSPSGSTGTPGAPATVVAAPAPEVKAGVKDGTFGIIAAFPAGGQPTIGGAYYFSSDTSLRLNVGVDWTFHPGSSFQFSVEPALRFYLGGSRLKPFLQPGLFMSYASAHFSLAVTGALGAEFFITNTLSLGAAAALAFNFTNLDDSGSRTIKLTTGTSALFLAYYW